VQGVTALSPTSHATVPDRIVAGTFAMAAVMTQGDVEIHNARPEHLEIVLDRLVGCGAAVSELDDGFHVEMSGRASAVDVVTLPYPGFPTDFLPMIIALNSVADGAAMVTENVFEGRFRFIQELVRLGADIRTDGHHAVIRGRERLSGAPVEATDIRAGAGLVLAGLVADGVTTVSELHHIDRGYADFVQQLQALGADVVREHDPSAMAYDQ
jgi:UDP-N-acetylglucosamine 1-carboxyvinyltransferase